LEVRLLLATDPAFEKMTGGIKSLVDEIGRLLGQCVNTGAVSPDKGREQPGGALG
jgi:hypothetical protein